MVRINRRTALKLGAATALSRLLPLPRHGLAADSRSAAAPPVALPPATATGSALKHPGLLHTAADFARMREKVAAGAEPWKSGWEKLIASPHASLKYKPRPVETQKHRRP